MTKRNDIHSPANIDPAAYDYQRIVDLKGPVIDPELCEYDPGMAAAILKAWRDEHDALKARIAVGGHVGNFVDKGTCDHCGAYFIYGAEFKHDNGEVIVVGNVCADKTLGESDRRSLDFKRAVAARKTTADRIKSETYAIAFLVANDLTEVFSFENRKLDTKPGHILADMYRRLANGAAYGRVLSTKQIAFAREIATEIATPKVKVCDFCGGDHKVFECPLARRAPQTGDRIEFVGRILFTQVYESEWGVRTVMTVLTEDGWTASGTVPAALFASVDADDDAAFKGMTVTIKARVQHYTNSNGEPRVSLKRPTAKIVDASKFTPNPDTERVALTADLKEVRGEA